VPNLSAKHVLYMAAWPLIMSTPGIKMVVIGEQPVAKKFYDDACKHIEGLKRGEAVDVPSDPTGADYSTPVSCTNPPVCLTAWGDTNGTKEDYARGYVLAANGKFKIALPVDDMSVM
jgi:hypothetical protein